MNVGDAVHHMLLDLLAGLLLRVCLLVAHFDSNSSCGLRLLLHFLIARRGPLRVLALVRVR